MRQWRRKRHEKDPEGVRARWRAAHHKNRARRLVRMKNYYEANHDAVRNQAKEHRKTHGERLRVIDRARWVGKRRDQANALRKISGQEARLDEPWKPLLKGARERARRKNVPYSLTEEWANASWTGRCAVTNLEFRLGLRESGPKFFSPSIDRIVPALGYVPDNCRFILWAVNAMKYDGTDADMYALAEAILATKPMNI